MPRTQFTTLAAVAMALLLQACAGSPASPDSSTVSGQEPEPELNLNLPDQADPSCACPDSADHDLLEKGFRALNAGDHREAVNYFRRYQRLETSPAVEWEAEIAVAYDKMFPKSPYYNKKAASESYHRLTREQPEKVHPIILTMRDSLAILVALHERLDEQQNENDVLVEELEKREEALKRLRELVLGQ